jgi:hypothetical protein
VNKHYVTGELGFSEPTDFRPRFFANDHSRDELNIAQVAVPIEDMRLRETPPDLDVEGFCLLPHRSAVEDFRDPAEVTSIYAREIHDLLLSVTGADHVTISGAGILRFAERSEECGTLDNSSPARFTHIDVSDDTAAGFYEQSRPDNGRKVRRSAQYNVWRVLSQPPQDVPLAICDARTLSCEDLITADALFDRDGEIVWSFEALLIRHNPRQSWAYFSEMRPDEALIFKTHDSDPTRAHHVAHGAFDDPTCAPEAPPRISIEMRGTAYWFE